MKRYSVQSSRSGSSSRSAGVPFRSVPVLRLLSLMLALLLFCGPAVAEEEEDPVVVRVGEFFYTRSQVQSVLNIDLAFSRVLKSEYLSPEERAAQKEATLDRLVGICLIKQKLSEAGRIDFTAAEEEALKSAARTKHEELWQQAWTYVQEKDASAGEEEVALLLNSLGISVESVYEEYRLAEWRNRAISLFCPDILINEEQVREYYEGQFVFPDRERYANDIQAYEEEILATGSESFYTPAGYRRLRQILLDYPEEIEASLRNDYFRLQEASERLSGVVRDLTIAATTAESWEDIAGPRKLYDEALAEATEAQSAYEALRKELTEPLIASRVDEIRNLFASGTPFLTLIDRFSSDKSSSNKGEGYPFHPDSIQWPVAFTEAASALEKPGDISEPVYTDLGIHILYYEGDIPSGEHILSKEEEEMLEMAALRYHQDIALEELIARWRGAYNVQVYPELLDD